MKNINKLFTFLLICLIATSLSAQDRFLDEVFTDVNVSHGDLMTGTNVYGINSTVLLLSISGEAVELPLIYDFYEPVGDTLSVRPLVIYFPTGNFLPIGTNGGVNGTMRDSVVVEISTRLAKMGYVVAVADYRKGWNPLAGTQPERSFQLINAAYRGVQDARTAIRFFKKQAATGGNTLKVDTTRITLWGQGTGGYITLGTSTLSEFGEIVTTTNGPGKFLTDLNMDGTPDPMVNTAWNGDIEGKTYGIGPNLLDPTKIDTFCIPNHVEQTSNFHLQVNMGGAMGDISWLEAGDVPMITFQSPGDGFAPYDDAVLKVPTTGGEVVQVQGGKAIHTKIETLGNNQVFKDASVDDAYTTAAQAASTQAGHAYFEGLYPLNRPLNAFGRNEGAPWEWWNSAIWSQQMHPSCADPNLPDWPTCNFDFIAKLNNPNDKALSLTYIDTIMGYFAPRAYAALKLDQAPTSTEEVLQDANVKLTIAPNPAFEQIRIRTELAEMKDVLIYDISGRLVQSHERINSYNLDINRGNLPMGMYIAKLRFEKGVITKKLVFR